MTNMNLEVDFSWFNCPLARIGPAPDGAAGDWVLAADPSAPQPRAYRPLSDYPALFRTFADLGDPNSRGFLPRPETVDEGYCRFAARFGLLGDGTDAPCWQESVERWEYASAWMR